MGAEGSINIYDKAKLMEIHPPLEEKYMGYEYTIFGHTVVVNYFGENSDYETWPSDCLWCYNVGWMLKKCEHEEWNKQAIKNAKVTTWEVWT